jgi:hypothetical protein
LLGEAVAVVDGVDVGRQHEVVDSQVDLQLRRCQVLVDHGLDAAIAALSILDDPPPPPPPAQTTR